MGLVFITMTEYRKRVLKEIQLLSNSFTVSLTSTPITQQITDNSILARNYILNILKRKVTTKDKNTLIKYLFSECYQEIPEIIALPKLHKPNNRMRLILPYNRNIFKTIHTFLAKTLQPIALRFTSALTSTYELIHLINQTSLPQIGTLKHDDLVVTADLESMYHNINTDLAIEFILQEIDKFSPEYNIFGGNAIENRETWKIVLHTSLQHAFFKFDNHIIRQTYGIPMGSPIGPIMAIIYINTIIQRNMINPNKPSHLNSILVSRMYIDDGFFIIRGIPKQEVLTSLNHLIQWPNSRTQWDPDSIKIATIKELETSSISFLDCEISCQSNSNPPQLISNLHLKPLSTHQYIHWRSAHPRSIKRAVIKGEVNRRLRVCSTELFYNNALEDLITKLSHRKYPILELQKVIRQYPFSSRRTLLNRTIARIRKHRNTTSNPYSLSHSNIHKKKKSYITPLIIRYDPRNHKEMQRIKNYIQDKTDSLQPNNATPHRFVIAYNINHKNRILSFLKSKKHPT